MVEEFCLKLRPVYGKKIDQLWKAYLVEDLDGKKDIEQAIQILYARTFAGTIGFDEVTALAPPPPELISGEYPIGSVTYLHKKKYPFGIREDDWIKHVLIVGASGSGKTNLCFQILKDFILRGKPFLVLDWKRNYRDIVTEEYGKNVRVFTVGRGITPFQFNPLIPPPGTAAKTWLKKLIEIIAHATFVGEGVMYLLQKGLDEVYQQFGVYDKASVDRYPTLKDLLSYIETMEAKGREAGWMSSTLRALGALTFGDTGKIFNVRRQSNMMELLNNAVILEMDSLTNSDKTFLVESLLLWIHHYRLSSPQGKREQFEHAIILEEAHHIIGKEKSDLVGGEAITDVIIREIRELGEAVIIIDQCPSLLSLPARANTWCTMVLNLKDAKDVNSAASALLLDAADKKTLGRLDVGEAVAKLQGRWNRPFTIQIPLVQIKKGFVSDNMIQEKMRPYSTYFSEDPEEYLPHEDIPDTNDPRKTELKISPEELKLLTDIHNHQFSGVVERYKRLKWSRRKGNEFKKSLTDKSLIDTEEIPTRSGRVVIMKLTKSGKFYVNASEKESETDYRKGGISHEYWKNMYADKFKNQGYDVILEKPVGGGKTVDIVATKDNERIAIEVETGRSDILANVEKCIADNFDKIILVATTEQSEIKVNNILKSTLLFQNQKIEIECARKAA